MIERSNLLLYLVTDRPLSLGRPIEEIVMEAVAGGVTMVQLREKEAPTGEFVALAKSSCKGISRQEVHELIDELYSEYHTI